ncbi:TonB-dependent receptor [Rufibacter latericius]|uniref:TonB-dependent receptor n=1 Tax=Rufibacter latericius TaxID=2487040 RepID=A0A3M9MV76_9BACT|nr:TonB-dependent receptor [Rufibacter latericius]RNI28823.1 TonB-dependent receptor [Rufibacter latericius]
MRELLGWHSIKPIPSFEKRLFLFFFFLFSIPFTGNAQNTGAVSGRVTDSGSKAIEFANVFIKGTEAVAQTNAEGYFSLSAPEGDYDLVISFVGYSTKTALIQIAAGRTTNLGAIVLSGTLDMEEVLVTGKTQNTMVKEEGFNVTVLDAKKLYSTSADLNQALNRTTGIRIREEGGVGSDFSFSLNGFSGKQVKFFLDGIPMDNFGSSLTLNNLPVTMAERVEVYKGVLPIHLGADALGGAVNIVTRSNPNFLDLSYGAGSFNTHKASINGAFTNPINGLTFRANAFYNYSDNNYKVLVNPINLVTSQKEEAKEVERFHDAYKSGTLQLEGGVTGKKYADLFLVGLIASGNDKEIQTGVTMEQVFGARTSRSSSVIPTLKYRKTDFLIKGLDVSLYSAYNMTQFRLVDTTRLKYNWNQETKQTDAAETTRTQLKNRDNEGLVTANLNYAILPDHSLSLNYVLSDFGRKSSDVEDPQNVTFQYPQSLKKQVLGLAWQMKKKRFNATAFSKLYLLDAHSFEGRTDKTNNTTSYQAVETQNQYVGYGAALAGFILPQLQLKASYEHAYRLPEAIELLGDGLFVIGNSLLIPESSDNINVGANYSFTLRRDHQFGVEASYLYRNSGDYIRQFQQQNQPVARQYSNFGNVITNGVEGSLSYAWKNRFQMGLNLTYQNIIDKEEFFVIEKEFTGTEINKNWGYDYPIPNTPYLFGNAEVGYSFPDLGAKDNVLTLNYSLNFVEEYYFTPHHLGFNNDDVIPRQLAQNAMVNYTLQNGKYGLSLECRNLTDSRLYDNFMLQKPGRSFFLRARYFINK